MVQEWIKAIRSVVQQEVKNIQRNDYNSIPNFKVWVGTVDAVNGTNNTATVLLPNQTTATSYKQNKTGQVLTNGDFVLLFSHQGTLGSSFIAWAFKQYLVASGDGIGDMLKSVYDTDNDGVVESADNADTVDGKHVATTGGTWATVIDKIPFVRSDGVIELARYIDFHTTDSVADYDIRLNCSDATTLNVEGGTLKISGNQVWHAGNDGTGSTLDADLLDGKHASEFSLTTHTHAIDDLTDARTIGLSVFLGSGSGNSDDGSNNANVAIGTNALNAVVTGSFNVATGAYALEDNTGHYNVANGYQSLTNNTLGLGNVASGYAPMPNNTTGSYNIAMGYNAMTYNTLGDYNIGIGVRALDGNTTGENNIAIGKDAGRFLSNGTTHNQTGTTSIFIGDDTKANGATQTNQIVIGNGVTGRGSNTVSLGNSAIVSGYLGDDLILTDADIGVTVQSYNVNTVIDASYVHTDNNYTTTEKNKLAGIESGATADQTASEILSALLTVDGSGSGLDADKIDGTEGTHIVKSPYSPPTGDFDTVIDDSYLTTMDNTALNKPTGAGSNWYNLINVRHRGGEGDGNNYGGQIAWGMNGDYENLQFRTQHSGTWVSWKKIWNSGNDGSGSGLDADMLDTYHATDFVLKPDEFNIIGDSITLATVTQTPITSFSASTYRSGKFTIQVYDTVSGEVQSSELLVIHNGTTASATEYAIIYSGGSALATFNVDISSGNVRILATGASANSTEYKISETLFTA